MKIKKRLTLNTWISLGVIILIALSLTWSFVEIRRTERNRDLIHEMQGVGLDRTSYRDEYLLNREERAKVQWQIMTNVLRRLLESASERFTDEEDRALLQEARNYFNATVTTFEQILERHQQEARSAKKTAARDETEWRMINQLFLKAYALQNSIGRLDESTDRAETKARNRGNVLVVFFILGGVIAVSVNSSMLNRFVTQRLLALNRGVKTVGEGNLDYRIDITGDDELSDLGRAGNEMVARLKESHTSVETLQREIAERRLTEEKLRESEEKYVKTFQSNPACVGLSRLRDALVIEANEVMLELLGYREDEFIGHRITELGVWKDPADRERLLRTLAADGKSTDREYWLRTRTGEFLLCNHSAVLIQMGDEPHVIFTFFDITERKRAQEALQEAKESLEQRVRERTMELQGLMEQLEKSRDELRKLASELVMSEERERKRIAGVLHDEIAQTLAAVRMRLDMLQDIPSDQRDKTVREAKELLVQSIQETRALMNDLGNPLLFDLGLKAACEALANRLMERNPIQIRCDIQEAFQNLDPDAKAMLYQVVRELLNNVVKHSQAQNAHILIDTEDGHFRVKVADDGAGFDPRTLGAPTVEGGFGLYSIRERLTAIDGNLGIESAPGTGTVVTAMLPAALE